MTKFKTAYSPHKRVQITFPPGSGRAQQSFADECDINNVMRRYEKTGILDHVNKYQGDYGDFTHAQDYQTSIEQVRAAQEAFDSLPAAIRNRFGNSPGEFLAFVEDEENEDEMRTMGLLPPREKEPPPPKVAGPSPAPKKTSGDAALEPEEGDKAQ